MLKSLLLFFLVAFSVPVVAQEKNLDYYISAGIQNSPLLKDYNNQQQSNQVDSLRILASLKPQVNGVSNNSYAPVIGGWGYDNAITNSANISALITVTKTILSKANVNTQFESISLQNKALNISGKITEQDFKKAITSQYITVYGLWQQYSFNKELYDLLKKEETILKVLTEKAVYRQTDYLTFLVTVQQQELQITQIKQQYQNEFATLNYICGLQDTSFVVIAAPALEPTMLTEIEQTIFYQQYQTDSLKLKNQDALIDYNYKPKLNLYTDGGYLSSLAVTPYKNFGISAGVSLNVPIYDGKQKKMQHDKINIAEQTRQHYRDYFTTQYNQQIAQLQQQLQSTQQLIDNANTQIKFSEGLMEANRKLLATGDARIVDYLVAISNYLNAKNIITQSTVNKLQIINQLNYWNRK
ncbi:TolC family protein [Panacibacter ginsenosidivorans]|uniref:TolC family protein n=1 Tax=Panacibacter ginsenosidivorans TaxID=1813871 RepID=A0A5B8V3R1_9BACT|nr:TolC family protein [Panacibacter ginsenosidivorans]QEC65842.1 TolC family protein [Panacibacter ginsenosidivorans]